MSVIVNSVTEVVKMTEAVYLDYNATTPLDEQVLEAMLPWMTTHFWNAASQHAGGRLASAVVERARAQVAALIDASPRDIVWTSGATESNNLALTGAARAAGKRRRVVVASTEHKAVLDTARALEAEGFSVDEAPVDRQGLLDEDMLERLLDDDVALVSVMLANNETGVIQPLRRISRLARRVGALCHTDATQATGRIPVSVNELGVDLASFSAHKMYGPKGVGCLFVRRGANLDPLIHGGGHEGGMRSGTTNVPGIVGFGAAADLASGRLTRDESRERELVARLIVRLRKRLESVDVVASGAERLPGTVSLRFVGADGEAVMVNAPGVYVSSGSACTSRVPDASHVLQAMGMTQDTAYQCLRFGVGRPTTTDDIDQAVDEIASAVTRVRALTPDHEQGVPA